MYVFLIIVNRYIKKTEYLFSTANATYFFLFLLDIDEGDDRRERWYLVKVLYSL